MTSIAVIGLGNIGLPVALSLLKAGFTVDGFDIRPIDAFVAAGGRQVESIAELGGYRWIVQSLPNPDALRASVDALISAAVGEQILVELSSYALPIKLAEADRLAAHGIAMLDCEISGLSHQVHNRTAVIFKSGDAALVEALDPVFDAIADRHFYLGAFGAATKMKLIANMMVCVHDLMAAEALHLGSRIGLDPATMVEVLKDSAAGSMTFRNKAPVMLGRSFEDGIGPFSHMFGYLRRITDLAEETSTATPLLDTTRAVFDVAEGEGRHRQDIAAVIEVVEALKRPGTVSLSGEC